MGFRVGNYLARFRSWRVVGAICLAALIVGGTWLYFSPDPEMDPAGERPVSESDHVSGDLQSPVTLVVYSDLSCPYCKSFDMSTMPRLQREYGQKIAIAYRHYPLPGHPDAAKKAEAAECVALKNGERGFWAFLHAAFADQRAVGHPEEADALIQEAVLTIGGDVPALKKCLAEGTTHARVAADMKDSVLAGARVTPTIIIQSSHGRILIHGDRYGQIRTGIEYLLSKESENVR